MADDKEDDAAESKLATNGNGPGVGSEDKGPEETVDESTEKKPPRTKEPGSKAKAAPKKRPAASSGMRRPAAADAAASQSNAKKRPAQKPKADGEINKAHGCSKCRYRKLGCGQCRYWAQKDLHGYWMDTSQTIHNSRWQLRNGHAED